MEQLVHQDQIRLEGRDYAINVFLRADNRFVATTHFSTADIICVDGDTLEEALALHRRLLPLAIAGRALRGRVKGACDA